MNNKYKKTVKKVGVLRSCDVLRLVRKVGVVGFVVVNVLSLVLAPIGFLGPVKVAEAAFRKLKTLRFRRALGDLSVALKPDLLSIVIIFA